MLDNVLEIASRSWLGEFHLDVLELAGTFLNREWKDFNLTGEFPNWEWKDSNLSWLAFNLDVTAFNRQGLDSNLDGLDLNLGVAAFNLNWLDVDLTGGFASQTGLYDLPLDVDPLGGLDFLGVLNW